MSAMSIFGQGGIQHMHIGGIQHMRIRGGKSDIFLGQTIAKSDIFGSKENWNCVHDTFWYQTSFNWWVP